MTIKRYFPDKDTTITNAYKADLQTRGTDANMGASDILEAFVIYAQASSASLEASRVLVEFPIDDLYSDIASGSVPDSGVSYYLRLFNAEHGETLPFDYTMDVQPLSRSFEEGHGFDMESYAYTGSGASWEYADNETSTAWTAQGGDFLTSSLTTETLVNGDEHIELDITSFVDNWILNEASGSGYPNYGLVVKFADAAESGSVTFYTKRFFAKTSEFWFKRPTLEARWGAALTDDRGNFYASSSLVSDIKNKLYFYNNPRGTFVNVPSAPLTVKFYDDLGGSEIVPDEGSGVTASLETTGKYYVTCSIDTTEEMIYDVWSDANGTQLYSGSIDVLSLSPSADSSVSEYVITIPKLKSVYRRNEVDARFDLFVRERGLQCSNVYTVANATPANKIVEDAFFQIRRVIDDAIVVDFNDDTEDSGTRLSYDEAGNHFNLDISMLQSGYMYEILFAFKTNGELRVQEDRFKFRVEK